MGQITRISTRDYRTEPQFRLLPDMLPKYVSKKGNQTGIEVLREHIDLIENPNSIMRVTSQLLRGTTKSGKKWVRWNDYTKDILSVKPNKAGNIRLNYLHYTPRGGFKNHTPYSDLYYKFLNGTETYDPIHDFLRSRVPERYDTWAKNSGDYRSLFYPGYLYSGITVEPAHMMPRLRVAMREENAIDMALSAFGKKHYRKDLVKSVATCQFATNIELAIMLRSQMKTDWLVEMMRSERVLDIGLRYRGAVPGDLTEYIPALVAYIPEHRRRRFVLSIADNHRQFNADAIRFATRLPVEAFEDIRTVRDLHERVIVAAPQLTRLNYTLPARYDIELNSLTEKYDGIETDDGLHIVAPKNSETVNEWSSTMSNCIRGYAEQAAKGYTNLGAVYDGEKLIANFEIDSKGNLKQLLGKYNNHLDIYLQSDIIEALEECGSITDRTLKNAWGVDLITVPEIS